MMQFNDSIATMFFIAMPCTLKNIKNRSKALDNNKEIDIH